MCARFRTALSSDNDDDDVGDLLKAAQYIEQSQAQVSTGASFSYTNQVVFQVRLIMQISIVIQYTPRARQF